MTCVRCQRMLHKGDYVSARVFAQIHSHADEKGVIMAISRPKAYTNVTHLYCEQEDEDLNDLKNDIY
jgi:hypothetical protein